MKIINAIKEAIKTANCNKLLPFTPNKIIGYALTHGDRWSGGHNTWYNGRYYRINNIRMADGTPKNQYNSLLNYEDGQLIADLVEDNPNVADPDNIRKLIAMAYYMGRETATREICDRHNQQMTDMRKRADTCRYHIMANAIIGDRTADQIYSGDYAGEMMGTFGADEINLPE